jgi:hypothetical protein
MGSWRMTVPGVPRIPQASLDRKTIAAELERHPTTPLSGLQHGGMRNFAA